MSRPNPDLSQVFFTTIGGERIEYQVHKRGIRKGQIHTTVGDFVSMEELGRYVRGRQAEKRAQDEGAGKEPGPGSRS